MKKSLLPLGTLVLAAICAFNVSCGDGDINYVADDTITPEVALEQVGESTPTSLTIQFTPTEGTARYEYALGLITDADAFKAGTLTGIENKTGNAEFTETFTNLEPYRLYVVYARAYDSNNNVGPVTSARVQTAFREEAIQIYPFYLAPESIAMTVETGTEYRRFEYALGLASDREAFEAGTLTSAGSTVDGINANVDGNLREIIAFTDTAIFTENYWDLVPETDYVFYVKAYSRYTDFEIHEITVRTPAKTDVPYVDVKVTENNVYRATIDFDFNEHVSRMVLFSRHPSVTGQPQWDQYMYSVTWGAGRFYDWFETWLTADEIYSKYMSDHSSSYHNVIRHPALLTDDEYIFYMSLYDKNGEPFCIQKVNFWTPEYDFNARKSAVDITIDSVSPTEVVYSVEANEYTYLAIHQVWDKAELDSSLSSSGARSIGTGMINTGVIQFMPESSNPFSFRITGLSPDTAYYVVVQPTNINGDGYFIASYGQRSGFGDLTMVTFTTPES